MQSPCVLSHMWPTVFNASYILRSWPGIWYFVRRDQYLIQKVAMNNWTSFSRNKNFYQLFKGIIIFIRRDQFVNQEVQVAVNDCTGSIMNKYVYQQE